MALKASVLKRTKTLPISFRLNDEVVLRIRTLSEILNKSQAAIISELIGQEYVEQLKLNAKKVESARRKVERSK